jgi:hypothetical protein
MEHGAIFVTFMNVNMKLKRERGTSAVSGTLHKREILKLNNTREYNSIKRVQINCIESLCIGIRVRVRVRESDLGSENRILGQRIGSWVRGVESTGHLLITIINNNGLLDKL